MIEERNQPPAPGARQNLTTMAFNMADALAYLGRVAGEAGLPRIALRLSALRVELLMIASDPDNENPLQEEETDAPKVSQAH